MNPKQSLRTIHRLGDSQPKIAGTDVLTTYRITACPRCYALVRWYTRTQTEWTCLNCGTVIRWRNIEDGHLFPYMRQHLSIASFHEFLLSILLILWSLAQWTDYVFRLRKIALYGFVKVLSWFP